MCPRLQDLATAFSIEAGTQAVFPPLNMGLTEISRSDPKQSKNASLISYIYALGCFVNFWLIFSYAWEEVVFLKGLVKFREIRNCGEFEVKN